MDIKLNEIIDKLPFEQMAESYVQYKKYEAKFSEWDKDTKEKFLKAYKGPGTGQSNIYNNTIEKIISGKEIGQIIDNFKKDNNSYEDFSSSLEGLIKKHQENHTPRQVIRAMAIMLHPTIYCQIADPNKLGGVYNNIPSPKSDAEWDEMNRTVQQHFIQEIINNTNNSTDKAGSAGNQNPIDNALIRLKELLKISNDDATKDDELKNFIVSFIPWEIYEQKIKVESLKKRLEKCGNLIFTGAPGTGKTYLAKEIAAQMIGCDSKDLEKSNQFAFVQFHPSYDYTDFVEGLRPLKSTNNSGVDFELKEGVFKEFCQKALGDSTKNFVFIIDEINRGEMSKIFGELFFSIDPGYRGKKGVVQTQYANMVQQQNDFDKVLSNNKKGQFFVPENVYIIGTMNDIDRSVESMDFAFRRRFGFIEVTAEDSMGMLGQLGKKANDARKAMKALNEALIAPEKGGLTYSYQIGGSYFLKLKPHKDKDEFISFEELWDYYLKGTLYEYFRGEPDADKKMTMLKKAYDDALKSDANSSKKKNSSKKGDSVTPNETDSAN